ncbi:MAG: hypothetical protein HOV81_38370 [Kofleriaceae bacterium]|nr:hypothetical protein [Kofleriaceae bacterium]
MGNDRDGIAGAFDIIESHLRAKGHDVRRDGLHIACAGVTFHAAEAGTFVMAATAQGQSAMLAALADLDAVGEHAKPVDEIRGKLARAKPVAGNTGDRSLTHLDLLDCSGCDLPCDLLDGLHHCDLGHCDVGGCDVPGCDLC